MALNIISFVAASLLGSMVFFAVVVAPTVFRVLEVDDAGRFIRTLKALRCSISVARYFPRREEIIRPTGHAA